MQGREFESDRLTLEESRAAAQVVIPQLNLKSNTYSSNSSSSNNSSKAVQNAAAATKELTQRASPACFPALSVYLPLTCRSARTLVTASFAFLPLPVRLVARSLARPHSPCCVVFAVLQPEVYALALALAQGPSTSGSSSSLAASALRLLGVLPTSPTALLQLRTLLGVADGGQRLRRMLQWQQLGPHAPSAPQPAVLMYAVQCLCVLLFPLPAGVDDGLPRGAAATQAEADDLCRRLLLSGVLEALLDAATQQAAIAAAVDAAATDAALGVAGYPAVAAAAHGALLLLLHRAHEAMERQQLAAVDAAAAATTLCEPTGMQMDGGCPSGAGGSTSMGVAPGPLADVGSPAAVADDASPSVSVEQMEAAPAAAIAAARSGPESPQPDDPLLPPQQQPLEQQPQGDTAAEVAAAAGSLAALAPAVARYTLRMLCSMLPDPSAGAAAVGPDVPRTSDQLFTHALQLLRQLAQQSPAAVQLMTGEEAAATEAVVCRLLLNPHRSQLRQLAADWLPSFAAAAPAAHRWAFERIVQPLLLAEATAGSTSSHEQLTLCNHFIETLDSGEVSKEPCAHMQRKHA